MSYNRKIEVFGNDNLLASGQTLASMYAGDYVYADSLNTAFFNLSTVVKSVLYVFGLTDYEYTVEDDKTADGEIYTSLGDNIKSLIKLTNTTTSSSGNTSLRLTIGDVVRNVTISTVSSADHANGLSSAAAESFVVPSGFGSTFTKSTTGYGTSVSLNTTDSIDTSTTSKDSVTVPTMSVIRQVINGLTFTENTDSVTIEFDDNLF